MGAQSVRLPSMWNGHALSISSASRERSTEVEKRSPRSTSRLGVPRISTHSRANPCPAGIECRRSLLADLPRPQQRHPVELRLCSLVSRQPWKATGCC